MAPAAAVPMTAAAIPVLTPGCYEAAPAAVKGRAATGTHSWTGREVTTAAADPRAAEIAAAHACAATAKVSATAAAPEVSAAATAADVNTATATATSVLRETRRRQRKNQGHNCCGAQDFQTFHDQNSFSRKQTP
jgi:hypothetical protein